MLPDVLDIPSALAASLRFDHGLNARDRSWLFSIAWYAARNEVDEDGDLDIPDLPLRRDLGDLRRQDTAREEARYDRLAAYRVRSDETLPDLSDGVVVPITPEGERRTYRSGRKRWRIDSRLRSNFAIEQGESIVGVPLRVLAYARCRYTLSVLLRLLYWGSGGYDPKWLRRNREDHLVLRIPVLILADEFGRFGKLPPSEFLRRDLKPALDEVLQLADIAVDIEQVHAPSIRAKPGRVIAYDLLVGKTEPRLADADSLPERAPAPSASIVPYKPIRFGPHPDAEPIAATTEDADIEF